MEFRAALRAYQNSERHGQVEIAPAQNPAGIPTSPEPRGGRCEGAQEQLPRVIPMGGTWMRVNGGEELLLAEVVNVRFWDLADIKASTVNVRFWGQSGHGLNVLRWSRLTPTLP